MNYEIEFLLDIVIKLQQKCLNSLKDRPAPCFHFYLDYHCHSRNYSIRSFITMTSPTTSVSTSRETMPDINIDDLSIQIKMYGRHLIILNVTILPLRITMVTIQVTTGNPTTNQWETSVSTLQLPTPLLGRTVFQRIN